KPLLALGWQRPERSHPLLRGVHAALIGNVRAKREGRRLWRECGMDPLAACAAGPSLLLVRGHSPGPGRQLEMVGKTALSSCRVGRWRFVCLLLVAARLFFLPSVALADTRADAKRYFIRGMAAIREGRHADGIDLLLKAYEIRPHPNVLFNVGRA